MNKSVVMRKAAKLRREGYDPSTALSMAWEGNPTSKTVAFAPSNLTYVLLAAIAFVVIWKLAKKDWPWASLGRSKIRRVTPLPTNQHRGELPYSMIIP